ncbi:HEAT repeat domain-containing protein [Geomobilimonas luticola]|uniref:HEAT repeat domain-containing protein n=1 Tax=Geomobilimonas luticola TaxID=1114878 RepID=A0ABS5SEY5_9BACT|nr:HEAT repeat domain-containing protein [Geomobilimonas luticola]MBT0653191.1 HEAT repeat domain-containing protein [Geomobilimonas luticola]
MDKLSERFSSIAERLEGLPVIELLLLVGDEAKGCKQEVLDMLLTRDFDTIYPVLERSVRNNALADLRNGAMEVLVHFGRQSVPRLIELLHDKDEEVRNFSTVMLGDIASRDAVTPLIDALNDPDANVRHGAAEALGRIGDRSALLPLLKLLQEDFWQQYPALAAIREMRDNRAVPYLLPLVNDEMLGEPAIEALATIGDRRAVPSLVAVLTGASPARSAAAARALRGICCGDAGREMSGCSSHPLLASVNVVEKLRQLADAGDGATAEAARALLELSEGPPAASSTAGSLADDEPAAGTGLPDNEQVQAALAAFESGVPLEEVLQNARTSDASLEQAIIATLGRKGTCSVVEALLALLERGDLPRHVEFAIVHALATASPCGHVAVNGLMQCTDHPDPDMRRLTLHAVACLDTPAALPAIFRGVDDPHWSVRIEALKLLAGIGGDEAVGALLMALDDTDVLVRKNAVAGLGKLGSMKAVVPLVNLLCDKEIGRGAFDALLAFGETALPELHTQAKSGSLEVRERVIDLVGRQGAKTSLPVLRELANDSHPVIRLAVIHAFWNCHDSSVLSILSRMHDNDPDPDVRHAAMVIKAGLDGETER